MTLKLEHEYRIVELNGGWLPGEVLDWLKANCDDGAWFYRHSKIYFEKPGDHLLFTIRWA
jgi:hypothetical protein